MRLMGPVCPAKELWPYPVGDGEPLKDLKGRDVVRSARRKQKPLARYRAIPFKHFGVSKIASRPHRDLAGSQVWIKWFLSSPVALTVWNLVTRKATLLPKRIMHHSVRLGADLLPGVSTPLLPFISGDNWELTALVTTVVMGIWSQIPASRGYVNIYLSCRKLMQCGINYPVWACCLLLFLGVILSWIN